MKCAGRAFIDNMVLKILCLLIFTGGALGGCASLPKDDAQLSEIKFEGLMGSRYTEILLVFGNAVARNFMAGVYNTAGLNGANPAGGGDSSPAAIPDKIDMKKVKEDNGALSTVKNGPRLWTVDHVGGKFGTERDFQGLKARWVMWFPIPERSVKAKISPTRSCTPSVTPAWASGRDLALTSWMIPRQLVGHEVGQPDQGPKPEVRRSEISRFPPEAAPGLEVPFPDP